MATFLPELEKNSHRIKASRNLVENPPKKKFQTNKGKTERILGVVGYNWAVIEVRLRREEMRQYRETLPKFGPDMLEWFQKTFWRNVIRLPHGCWIWTGRLDSHGYGQYQFKGTTWRAHRFSYLLTYGRIPDQKMVCHKCNHPRCVNPFHLYTGTAKDNAADRKRTWDLS